MKHGKLIALGVLLTLVVALLLILSRRNPGGTPAPRTAREAGDREKTPRATDQTSPAKSPTEPEQKSTTPSDISGYPEVRDRLLNVFARTRGKWLSLFNGLRWNPNLTVLIGQLIDDKDFIELAASLGGEENAGVRKALRSLFESSRSDLAPFTLLLLAQTGHRDHEDLFLRVFKAADAKDRSLSVIAAFGLGKLGTAEALEPLAQEFRTSLFPGGKPNWMLQSAIGQGGPAGFHILLEIGEELVQRGSSTPEDFKKLGFVFPTDPRLAEELRQVAGSHASPAIRVLAIRSLVSSLRSADDLGFVLSRVEGETDAMVRAEILKSAADSALRNELKALDSQAKVTLARALEGGLRSDQGRRLKVMLKLDPAAEMSLARSVMLGIAPEGVDAGKLDAILFENLPSVDTDVARKLMQEYALKMGVLDCLNPLAQLGGRKALTDERLIAPLFDLLAKAEAGQRIGHPTTALWAITGFPDSTRDRIATDLEAFYATAKKPEIRMAVLEGFGRLGPRGEEILMREARNPGDFSTRLAAWNALSKSGAFERNPGLMAAAKDFLRASGQRPPEATRTPAGQVESVHYLELFSTAYVAGGVAEDLALLKEVTLNPTLPSPNPHMTEQLRNAAAASIEAIELRSRAN